MVKKMKTCKYLPNPDYKEDWIPAKFHGIYQHSKIVAPSPFQGGHSGGTVTFPAAVVEDDKGLHEVEVWRVKDIEGEE